MKAYVYHHAFSTAPLHTVLHRLSEHTTITVKKLPLKLLKQYLEKYEKIEEYVPSIMNIDRIVEELENYEADLIIVTSRFFLVISVQ